MDYFQGQAAMKNCAWKCGRQTKNHTGICDDCWCDRERTILKRGQSSWDEEYFLIIPLSIVSSQLRAVHPVVL